MLSNRSKRKLDNIETKIDSGANRGLSLYRLKRETYVKQ